MRPVLSAAPEASFRLMASPEGEAGGPAVESRIAEVCYRRSVRPGCQTTDRLLSYACLSLVSRNWGSNVVSSNFGGIGSVGSRRSSSITFRI